MALRQEAFQQEYSPNDIERVVVVVNEHSTSAKETNKHIEDLKSSGYGSRITKPIETSADPRINYERFSEEFRDGDAIILAGGDGTAHDGIRTCLNDNLTNKNIWVFPLWGGNANDGARMINGEQGSRTIADILDVAKPVEIHPIRINLKYDAGDEDNRISAFYAGFGLSATVAEKLDKKSYRDQRFYDNPKIRKGFYEPRALMRAYGKASEFVLKSTVQDGSTRSNVFLERSFLNGSRMAGRKVSPIEISDRHIFEIAIREKKIDHLVPCLGKVLFGHIPAGRLIEPSDTVSFKTRNSISAHFDATAELIQPGTSVTIKRDERSFFVLSTKLTS